MSPFSCQAKRDIKYFPSRARARQDRSGEPRALERGDTEREREGEGRSEEGWEEEKDKEAENCASRENGKPENDHQPKAHATPFPYHSFAFFSLSLSLSPTYLLSVSLSSLSPLSGPLARHHPRHCVRPARRPVSRESLYSGAFQPPRSAPPHRAF